MEKELPPDSRQKKIRIGCGSIAGLAFGLFVGIISFQLSGASLWIFTALVGFAFSFLAIRFGERFWLRLLQELKSLW
jgi:hypothetical protein